RGEEQAVLHPLLGAELPDGREDHGQGGGPQRDRLAAPSTPLAGRLGWPVWLGDRLTHGAGSSMGNGRRTMRYSSPARGVIVSSGPSTPMCSTWTRTVWPGGSVRSPTTETPFRRTRAPSGATTRITGSGREAATGTGGGVPD